MATPSQSYIDYQLELNKQIWEERNIILHIKQGKNSEHILKSFRYNTYIFTGLLSKNKMKEYMLSFPENKIVVQINHVKGYRQFISFPNWDIYWSKYIHTGWNKRYLNELILSDKPCKSRVFYLLS